MISDIIEKLRLLANDDLPLEQHRGVALVSARNLEQLQAEKDGLKNGLIKVRKSTEIMEARRLAGEALGEVE